MKKIIPNSENDCQGIIFVTFTIDGYPDKTYTGVKAEIELENFIESLSISKAEKEKLADLMEEANRQSQYYREMLEND